jgi:isocitrate dehydrogenase kinase/phosphatase
MSQKFALALAEKILSGFKTYMGFFNTYTRLAPIHFRERDWLGTKSNQLQRLRLYKDVLIPLAEECRDILQEHATEPSSWALIKNRYSTLIKETYNIELAETFFNSVVRKILPKTLINEEFMFVMEGFNSCEIPENSDLLRTYPSSWDVEQIIRKILDDYDFGAPFMDKEQDISHLVKSVKDVILSRYRVSSDTKTQLMKPVFYRNKAAYLIGRTYLGHKWMPFIIPMMHGPKGVFVDTLIFDPHMMSNIFSFTRSYFMVEVTKPSQIVAFLSSVIPHKKSHELYNSLGFNKHGKTLLHRDFLLHLAQSKDKFEIAPGIKGMVMTVFTLPSLNLVFKLIKDHFEPPKSMTRQEVQAKYKFVSLHDRVGRMADTHEFEYFCIPLDRISPELLREFRNTVNSLIEIRDDKLIIKHLYTQRKLIPLNIYMENCTTEEGINVAKDYGRSVLQMAQANIFPGDMMTKNFGLTRQNRVIFYDYDEIEILTDMNFRQKPKAETYEQIYAPEPWYSIAKNDVFPADFKRWMIGRADVKAEFLQYHERLFDSNHWSTIQSKIAAGELLHAFPYPEEIRFRPHEPI